MENNNEQIIKNLTNLNQSRQKLARLLPRVIGEEDFKEAVDILVGKSIVELNKILESEPNDKKKEIYYNEVKIKAINSILKLKQLIFEEEKYFDQNKFNKNLEIPKEYHIGNKENNDS